MSSENILQTVKLAMEDVVAPEVRELKAELKALGHRMDGLDKRMDAFERRVEEQFAIAERRTTLQFTEASTRAEAQFQAILAAIARSTAEQELMVYKHVAPLAQRIAALEAARQPAQ